LSISGSPPSVRWGACAACIGTKLLYFGGMSLENFCDFKVYALETEQSYAGELAKNGKMKKEPDELKEKLHLKE
jgi:hypothetical protein